MTKQDSRQYSSQILDSDSEGKERVLSDFIGLNPTGTLTFEGTFQMNGSNTQVLSPEKQAKENLKKTQENQFICENFGNQSDSDFFNLPRKNNLENQKFSRFFLIVIFFYILLLILSLFHHFK